MKIGAPKESAAGEARVAMTPQSAKDLQKLGYECLIQKGAGEAAGFDDKAYEDAGVTVVSGAALWKDADVVAKVRPPTDAEAKKLQDGQTLISFFYPAANEKLLEIAKNQQANVIAMDMVPTDQPGAEDGRAVLDGEHCGLSRGDRGRQQLWPLLHRSGDGRR